MENSEKELPEKNNAASWDSSVIIALIAVLISLVSVVISYKEAQIMTEQQGVLTSQQEASVWPYLDNSAMTDYPSDTVGIFRFLVVNKGVGPAIINSVSYQYKNKSILLSGLKEALKKDFPNLEIMQTQSWELSNIVLAPGDPHFVITIQLMNSREGMISITAAMREIEEHFSFEYCYCSIYGKCWKVEGFNKTFKSGECEFREDIR